MITPADSDKGQRTDEQDVPLVDFDPEKYLHHTKLPETPISIRIDPFVRGIGKLSSWVWPLLVVVITVNVVLRFVIGKGFIEFEELQWHLYAVGFLLALAWCLAEDNHVRIDVLSEHFRFRTQCWIELVGILMALLPFVILVVWYSIPFVTYSFSVHEISEAPGGLPYRWAMKLFLLIAFSLLLLATLSRLSKVFGALFTKMHLASK